jgi:hypothetical protein
VITPKHLIAVGAACLIAVVAGPIAAASGTDGTVGTATRHHAGGGARPVANPPRENSLQGDGPHVVRANAFTTDHRGLKPGQIEMTTVDARPMLIAGHRAKVVIRGLQKDDHLQVVVDGQLRRHTFHHVRSRPGQAKGAVEGVVKHLSRGGYSVVEATARDKKYGRRTVYMELDVHSLQGPVITGPHQQPFVCQTEDAGLGAAKGPNCLAKTRIHWWYKDQEGNFHRLAHPRAPYPSSVATTMSHGKQVPFVLRVENIVINRSVTRLAVLDDPRSRPKGKPFKPLEWNHDLAWHFGESCGTGFHQGSDGGEISVFSPLGNISSENLAGPLLDLPGLLSHGYMVGESSLTIFGVHCNQVLSAETLMMVKEFITTHFGDVLHVVGGGASGGAIQQYTIANGYPGLLDAGTPLLSFPDVVSTAMTVGDCVVLKHYFGQHKSDWQSNQRTDVTGLATTQVCDDWDSDFGDNLKPTSCPGGVDPATVYNKKTNPDGVRCDLQDDLINVLGTNHKTGAALRPLDNVGVQYGLVALRHNQITPAQFVDLNRGVGGVNLDGGFVKRRERMTRYEAHRIFADSLVGEFGAINQTPIIDQTIPVSDDIPELDIHDQIRPYEIRARLDANYGNHRSQAIWAGAALPASAIVVANQWLTALDELQAKHPWKSRAWLVAHSRPAAADDSCRVGSGGVPVPCSVGKHAGPRQKAGGPIAEDVVKCRLHPVRRSDYPDTLTDAQFTSLKHIFRSGVCAYSKHSVGFRKRSRTWLSFGDRQLYSEPVVVPYPLVRSRVPRR